jgi:hypothetical protein
MAIQSINEPQTPAFDHIAGSVKPSITAIDPASVEIGADNLTLTITGEGFGPDTVIYFASHDEPTTLEDDGTVSTGLKPSLWTAPATVQCYVRNGTLHSDPVDFEFTAPAVRSGEREREDDEDRHDKKKHK